MQPLRRIGKPRIRVIQLNCNKSFGQQWQKCDSIQCVINDELSSSHLVQTALVRESTLPGAQKCDRMGLNFSQDR